MVNTVLVGMHGRTAIRFYEIHTPLTEEVLPDSGNYKTIVFVLSVTMKKNNASSGKVAEF
jgi:hypothetical protein